MSETDTYSRFGKNVVLMSVGSFSSKLLSFLFVPFYTSVLTTSEYGTADLVTTTISLLFPFFTLVICEAMMRFALDKTNDPSSIYMIGVIVWFVGFVAVILISPLFTFVPSLKNYIVLLVLYYGSYSIYNTISYFVRGIEKIAIYSISGILNTAIVISLNMVLLLILKKGVEGYLISFIIANGVSTLFVIFASGIYKYKLSIKNIDKNLFKRMLQYSLPMIPNSASWWVSNSSDRYILTYFAGVAVNGIYSVAYKIPSIISVVSSIFMSAWRISAVDNFGSEESVHFYSDIFSKYIALTASLTSLLLLLNKSLASLLYQKEFYQAWAFVPVLLLAAVMHSYGDFFGTIYTSAMQTKMLFYSTIIGAVTNVALNFLLIPFIGALGAALATLASYFAVFLIRLVNSRRIIKIKFHLLRDGFSLLLIAFQVVIASIDFQFEYVVSFVIFLVILVVQKKNILEICKIAFSSIKFKNRKSR